MESVVTLNDVINAPNILHTCSIFVIDDNYKDLSIYFQSYLRIFKNKKTSYKLYFIETETNSIFELLRNAIKADKNITIENRDRQNTVIKSFDISLRKSKIIFKFDIMLEMHYVVLKING